MSTLRQIRIDKIDQLREAGIHPYPAKYNRSHTCIESGALDDDTQNISIAGRMVLFRSFGSLAFATLQDQSGRMQVAFAKKELGDMFKTIETLFDLGDFIGVEGYKMTTKHGEATIMAQKVTFLGKALRGLPEKFHGVSDTETVYRQRYLDTIMNPESFDRFKIRGRVIKELRNFLDNDAFEEIETPILSSIAGGAAATPFATHHNALDIPMTLRIAPELYLKRAIVGGYDAVYEMARCFRNEGIDPSHLQEFTMLEFYKAYADYNDTMDLTEKMFDHIFDTVFDGQRKFQIKDRDGNDTEIDFTTPWPRKKFRDIIFDDSGIDIDVLTDKDSLVSAIQEKNIAVDQKDLDTQGYGNLVDTLYKKVSRPKLIQPCFVIQHPIDTKPLARKSDDNPAVADTYQLLVNTWEMLNAYSELVDPMDQTQRLERQAAARDHGDEEAFEKDDDYLLAMEYGMPPISGWGMGVDRLVTLLTGQDNLRDSVLYPMMRPRKIDLQSDSPFEG
ncbi:MAG: lysine--tRNA ligase [Patescibacteria group bacterium]|nr:lysine--tRNA ligase [Patescibacteria group bacterium]